MKVKNLISNDVAWAVEKINSLYQEGNLKGFTFQITCNDNNFITGSSGNISFLEKLGLIEAAKHDLFLPADE